MWHLLILDSQRGEHQQCLEPPSRTNKCVHSKQIPFQSPRDPITFWEWKWSLNTLLRRWLDTPIISWEYDWMPRDPLHLETNVLNLQNQLLRSFVEGFGRSVWPFGRPQLFPLGSSGPCAERERPHSSDARASYSSDGRGRWINMWVLGNPW